MNGQSTFFRFIFNTVIKNVIKCFYLNPMTKGKKANFVTVSLITDSLSSEMSQEIT